MRLLVKNLFYKHGRARKDNKAWEIQVYWLFGILPQLTFEVDFVQYPSLNISILGLFMLNVYNSKEEDHAGFYFTLNILGLHIEYSYYDIRHWDYNNDKWEEYATN